MKKKKIFAVLSAIAIVAAAFVAVYLFRKQLASLIQSLSARRNKLPPDEAPQPDFTDEEREAFADI